MKHITLSFLAFFLMASSVFAIDRDDRETIHHIINHFTNAWNVQAGHGSADYYEDNGDFVNIFGMHFSGKEEIEQRHVKIHDAFLSGSIFKIVNVNLREVKPDIVLAHVTWNVTNIPQLNGSTSNEMNGIFTHVFIKQNGEWKITATQNTLFRPQ